MPDLPRNIGRYRIEREIWRGDLSVVYLATQAGPQRQVALKRIGGPLTQTPGFTERFLREVTASGTLSHPWIVPVYEYLEDGGAPYIATEFMPHGSMRPVMRRLTAAQIAGALETVLAALAHAERRGVTHRNLKPENLMPAPGGVVRVTDFGVARAVEAAAGSTTAGGAGTIGTPAYMSPEQAAGGDAGPAGDLYACGVIAYELCLGRLPFPVEGDSAALLEAHASRPPPRPSQIDPAIPAGLERWLLGMLAKDPDQRPADAGEAWNALEAALLPVLDPSWRRHSGVVDRPHRLAQEPPTPGATERRTRRRGALLASVTGAVVTLAAAVAGVALLGRDTGEPPTPAPAAGATMTPAARPLPVPPPTRWVASTDSRVFVSDPAGAMAVLAGDPLGRVAAIPAAAPRRVGAASGRVYLLERSRVRILDASDLSTLGTIPFPGGVAVFAQPEGAVVAAADGSGGRVCVIDVASLGPCADLAFTPTGLGAATPRVFVADGAGGRIRVLRRTGATLTDEDEIVTRPGVGGRIFPVTGRLVASAGGGLVISTPGGALRNVPLGEAAGDLTPVPETRTVWATLNGADAVAVVDVATGDVRRLPVGADPVSIARWRPAPGVALQLAVVHADGAVVLVDAQRLTQGATLAAGES